MLSNVKSQGTGYNFAPSYVTNVTGGGSMPSTTNGYTLNADNSGNSDVTSALQSAADAAASQGKPLLIPSGTYKISGAIYINCSVIGIGEMPTIRQVSDAHGLRLVANMTGWISTTGYLFLDQKRKLKMVTRIKKNIAKFDLKPENIGFCNSLITNYKI